jgi:catechol 2,3-dioxygenase-like lactoylglutathione lyase family enzyme
VPRIDHVAVESARVDEIAAFYERFLGARIVRTEGHPVMAYLQSGAMAIHEQDGPGTHVAFRVSNEERKELQRQLEESGIDCEEKDHEIAVGLFFEDPDGRQLEAITYRGGEDPRRPGVA